MPREARVGLLLTTLCSSLLAAEGLPAGVNLPRFLLIPTALSGHVCRPLEPEPLESQHFRLGGSWGRQGGVEMFHQVSGLRVAKGVNATTGRVLAGLWTNEATLQTPAFPPPPPNTLPAV